MSSKVNHDDSKLINFSNALITWEIENFRKLTATKRVICTPPITLQGRVETLWKIYLRITPNKKKLLLNVEMLPNESRLTKVDLHWAFCLSGKTENCSFSAERTFSYEPKSVMTLEYFSLESMLEIASKKENENLIFKCRMLVDFGMGIVFPKLRVTGVELLSYDLCDLPTSYLYHDVTTTIDNSTFSLHNAMLFYRGAKLVRFLEKSTSNVSDIFSLLKAKAVHAVFKYIYSGNLKFILDDPSLTISDYLEHVELPELNHVYSQQIITVSSKLELKDNVTDWKLPGLKYLTRTVLGPEFKIEGIKSRFQLSLDVTDSKDDPPKKSLSVEVKLIESDALLVLCVDFEFGTDENPMLCTRRIHGMIGPRDKLGVTLLEDDCPEMKELLLNKTLSIKVKVYRNIGEVSSCIVENQIPIIKLPNEKSFMNLSKALGEIKRTSIYNDFYFEVGDKEIKAHKFLAAARCPLMKELLRRNEGLTSVQINGYSKDVFEKFLDYMYIGILTENDCDKLIELYSLAKQYNVDGLLSVVSQVLSKCINEENMLRILIFAEDIEDHGLCKTALNYVMDKIHSLQNHADYPMLRSRKPDVCRMIQNILSVS